MADADKAKSNRWDIFNTFLALVAFATAAATAYITYRQNEQQQSRAIGLEGVAQFDDDHMWAARLSLFRNFYVLCALPKSRADVSDAEHIAAQTAAYFARYVYENGPAPANDDLLSIPPAERGAYFREVDRSRRFIKTYYEALTDSERRDEMPEDARRTILRRTESRAGQFLRQFWLPVEIGQNVALYGSQSDGAKSVEMVAGLEARGRGPKALGCSEAAARAGAAR